MKTRIITISLLGILLIGSLWANKSNEVEIKDGDIIFQTSKSEQSRPIQIATKSIYSHCGIIYKKGNDLYVYEAVGPVKLTPLKQWIARGKNNSYVIKRLKNSEKLITPDVLSKMKKLEINLKANPMILRLNGLITRYIAQNLFEKYINEVLVLKLENYSA